MDGRFEVKWSALRARLCAWLSWACSFAFLEACTSERSVWGRLVPIWA